MRTQTPEIEVWRQSITAFVDSMQYFQEYVSERRPLDLAAPFPAYIYRLLLSQARLSDERRLKAEHKMSHATLIRKIEANFSIDKKSGTCSLRNNKGGIQLVAALQFITSFIHSRAAFHVRDFHKELKDVMRAQKLTFDEAAGMSKRTVYRSRFCALYRIPSSCLRTEAKRTASWRPKTTSGFSMDSADYRPGS